MAGYEKLKVVDLKAELKKRGLPQTGLKQALVDRLLESDKAHSDDAGDQTVPKVQPTDDGPASTSRIVVSADSTEAKADENPHVEQIGVPAEVQTSRISPPPLVPVTELVEDSKKRKRRSQSPQPSASDSAKKLKQSDASSNASGLKENSQRDAVATGTDGADDDRPQDGTGDDFDADTELTGSRDIKEQSTADPRRSAEVLIENGNVDNSETGEAFLSMDIHASPSTARPNDDETTTAIDIANGATLNLSPLLPPSNIKKQSTHEDGSAGDNNGSSEVRTDSISQSNKDARFKKLFQDTSEDSKISMNSSEDPLPHASDHDIAPALHIATSSLYIRNFMRPLQPAALERHISKLASPSTLTSQSDNIVTFYLDSIRTHCFVRLQSIAAATRVRSALHDHTWPDERNRKPLWADFIPEEKLETWIEAEKKASGGKSSSMLRWEVNYRTLQSDSAQGVEAVHQEIGTNGRTHDTADRTGFEGVPQGPRRSQVDQSHPMINRERARLIDQPVTGSSDRKTSGFGALDTLFKSTTSKPVLYFQPVATSLANSRLSSLSQTLSQTAKEAHQRKLIEGGMSRYSFEGGDVLISLGPAREPGQGSRRARGRGRGPAPYSLTSRDQLRKEGWRDRAGFGERQSNDRRQDEQRHDWRHW